MAAPVTEASSSFVKHLVPVTLGRSIELSVPKVRRYFYFDVLKALNTESKVPPNPIIPCTAPKMPHFREEFLRQGRISKMDCIGGYETHGKEFQELIINSEGRSHFNAERWPDWIRKAYMKNKNKDFIRDDPYSLAPYGVFEIEIGKHLAHKKAKEAYRLTYFKPDMCLDESGPIQLYTDKMYSTYQVTDSNWENKLINYLDLRLMGTTRAIIGHKDVNTDPFNVEKLVSYEFLDFQRSLRGYLQEEYLLAGAEFAYKFIDKNVQLLRDHPEGYWTWCNLTTHDREATIQLNKFEDRISKYVPASFARLREEYRLD